ncbi:MAG: transglutaminase domain-containing protein [archaeon]|jgi:hypothetical protein
MKKAFLILTALVLIVTAVPIVSAADDENTFYPTTIGEMTALVRIHGWGTVSGLEEGEDAKLQILTFQESEIQHSKIIKEALYINAQTVMAERVVDEFGNNYARFSINENGNFTYELIAEVTRKSLIYALDDYNISDANLSDKEKLYLKQSNKIESDSSEIKTVAMNKLQTNSFIDSLNETVAWVNSYVKYAEGDDFYKYYTSQKSALETLFNKEGVCDEFANLAAAILRAKGIPAQVIIGITFDGQAWGNHAWISVRNSKGEWISSDPTFREAGFVDATHIRLGTYSDVTLSLAKAFYPSTAKISFYTQTIPDVQILSKKYFDAVEASIEDSKKIELKEKTWNSIKVKVTNKTTDEILVPVSLPRKFSKLYIHESSQSVFLKSKETKEIEFLIYPDLNLNNQVATAYLRVNTLSTPIEKEFTVIESNPVENGKVQVKDVTPIVTGKNLQVNIEIGNYKIKNADVNIKIYDGALDDDSKETLETFLYSEDETTPYINEIKKEIKSFKEGAYSLRIETPTEIYLQEIRPLEISGDNSNEPDKNTEQTPTITQQITLPEQETIFGYITSHPEIPLAIVLFGIVAALLIVVSRNKRYI